MSELKLSENTVQGVNIESFLLNRLTTSVTVRFVGGQDEEWDVELTRANLCAAFADCCEIYKGSKPPNSLAVDLRNEESPTAFDEIVLDELDIMSLMLFIGRYPEIIQSDDWVLSQQTKLES